MRPERGLSLPASRVAQLVPNLLLYCTLLKKQDLLGAPMIFRGPYADVPVPTVPFHQFVLHRAEKLKAMPALIDAETGRTLTYEELAQDVYRFAGALAARGMRKGDVFALMLPNVPEFATAFYGVLAAGGVVTTLNPLYTSDEIAHQLEDSGAKYLVTLPQWGLRKRSHGGNENPTRNRKSGLGNPPPTAGASELYPNHHGVALGT